MQIKYKFHDWSMLQDTADDFWQTLKSFLIIYQVLFQFYISEHKILHHLVLIESRAPDNFYSGFSIYQRKFQTFQ